MTLPTRGEAPQGGLEPLRQETIDRLTEAFANDAIGMDEYERRTAAASAAGDSFQLERLTYDLPAVKPTGRAGQPRADVRADVRDRGYGGDASIVGAAPVTTGCVMSDRQLTGDWLTSDRVSSFTVMGSTKLDLRDTALPPGPVRIEAFTLMGETKIIVPRDVPVKMTAFAFMGESRAAREVSQRVNGARTWVEVSGFAMMGSVVVRAMD